MVRKSDENDCNVYWLILTVDKNVIIIKESWSTGPKYLPVLKHPIRRHLEIECAAQKLFHIACNFDLKYTKIVWRPDCARSDPLGEFTVLLAGFKLGLPLCGKRRG